MEFHPEVFILENNSVHVEDYEFKHNIAVGGGSYKNIPKSNGCAWQQAFREEKCAVLRARRLALKKVYSQNQIFLPMGAGLGECD
jgi:hypothetical protein